MWFYVVFTWLAYGVQFMFLTLSLAAGLYYVAELVEEYTALTARIIRFLILITSLFYVCLWLFESLPLLLFGFGLLAQLLHLMLLRLFPVFMPASPSFIGSVVLLFVNNYLAIRYFVEKYHTFGELMAYMTLCVWMVPLSFFVSLSANDQTLPLVIDSRASTTQYGVAPFLTKSENDVVSVYFSKQKRGFGLLSLFKRARESVLPMNVQNSKRFS